MQLCHSHVDVPLDNAAVMKFVAFASVLLVGCSTVGHFSKHGLERAAFEMNCPKEKLAIVELEPGQVGVSGCEQRLVYVYVGGNWMLNSETVHRK